MHSILLRQLKRLGFDEGNLPDSIKPLIEQIDRAYQQFDEDRNLIERSLDLSSKELGELNAKLEAEIASVSAKSQELEKALSLAQAAFDSTVTGILVMDLNGKIISYNKQFYIMWKIPFELIEQKDDKKLLEFVHDQLKYPDEFTKRIEEIYSNPSQQYNDILEFTDGRIFERTFLPQTLNGQIVGRVWSFHDITKQRQAEEAVRKSEKRYQTIIEHSSDVILIVDQQGMIQFETPGITKLLGYSFEMRKGHSLFEHIHPDDIPKIQAEFVKLLASANATTDEQQFRIYNSDGEVRWCEGVGKNLLNDESIQGIIITFRDITERKNSDVQFKSRTAEVERMNELMVGREIKMIELKKQIETLTQELQKFKTSVE